MKTKVIEIESPQKPRDEELLEGARILREGGLVAFPTETVYGLGANALDEEAARKIYEAKGRPSDNPLIAHVSAMEEVYPLVSQVSEKAKKLIEGGYDGKTVVLGIRPEDVHDEADFIAKSPDTVIEAKIRVYEMLGAEVFLYFDYEGANMTARVEPKTAARTGDVVKFALDAEKIHVFDKETEETITN